MNKVLSFWSIFCLVVEENQKKTAPKILTLNSQFFSIPGSQRCKDMKDMKLRSLPPILENVHVNQGRVALLSESKMGLGACAYVSSLQLRMKLNQINHNKNEATAVILYIHYRPIHHFSLNVSKRAK